MNKIEGYAVYQQSYADNTQKAKTWKEAEKNVTEGMSEEKAAIYEHAKANGTNQGSGIKLSDKAKDLLKELKKKYGNMDIMVANVESDEEASELMSHGTKEYSVLIDPEELEKMANDKDYKAKQLAALEKATGSLDELKAQLAEVLGDDIGEVANLGISINAQGELKYFAYLEQETKKQGERIHDDLKTKKENQKKTELEAAKAKKQEKAEEALKSKFDAKAEDTISSKTAKHAFIEEESKVDLLEAITGFDWETIADTGIPIRLSKLDLSV